MRHAQLCKSDILYELLYGANDETLLSHVKGLIDAKDTPKPGQLTLLLGPMEWSAELQDAMKLLRGMDQHPILGQPEHAGVRRTAYHAVLMACLPHIASFTMYVLDHSKSRESCMRFIHESLIKSEEQFFYGSAASESAGGSGSGSGAAAGLESWVNYAQPLRLLRLTTS